MGSDELKEIRRAVLADAAGIVLEIGIGPGHNLPFYQNISKLYALDPSRELIGTAKGRASSLAFPVEFLIASAEKIPLPNHSIDTVVSTWTLCSVSNLREVLREIKRVLRPPGNFIFCDHGASSSPFWRIIQTGFTAITKHFTGNCHFDRKIEEMIKESGFKIKKIDHPRTNFNPLIYNYRGVASAP